MTPDVPSLPDWIKDPDAIYRQSFALIDAETDWCGVPASLRPVVRRMIHACGMTDLAGDVRASSDFVAAATAALRGGAPVLCDSRMVAEGLIRRTLPADNAVRCLLDLVPETPRGTTRSAAAIDALGPTLAGALVVVGNAPTALFRLLERLAEGAPAPAAVVATPVGFVGAVESKAALVAAAPAPFVTVVGRRGGSAMAAAAVNALAVGCAAP